MIDFPASPTDGQTFSATNGVIYKYSVAYSSWLAQNPAPPLGGTGEVTATNLTSFTFDNGIADLLPFPNIVAGNAGLWWNTTTRRYTPPAGKYFLTCSISVQAPGGGNGTVSFYLRKNGTQIGTGATGSGSPAFSIPLSMGEYVDANGSDYFEWWGLAQAANMTFLGGGFSAFPLSGIQGPTGGPPGPVVGDFCATGAPAVTAAFTPMVLPTILTGNSGAYYNTSNGRYTPPAGRYLIFGWIDGFGISAAGTISSTFYKNGVQVPGVRADAFPGAATGSGSAYVQAIVDANGSDYFEFRAASSQSLSLSATCFGATPTQGMVGPQGPMGPAGVTQTVFFETGAVATGTTLIPFDDTIPQQTEGDQYMSLSITPQSATSKLIIEVLWNGANSLAGNNVLTAALFQDAGANAIATGWTTTAAAGAPASLSLRHTMTSGTTSATTFKMRAGTNNASTTTFNGQSGNRLYGGVMASSIVIREVP